jgi:hypothetical protein
MNQGKLEAELPPTLNIPTHPSFNVTDSEVINVIGPVLTANVAPQVTACNASVSSSVTTSNPTCPANTPTITSTTKSSKKPHLVSLSRPRILQIERDAQC